MLEKTAGGPESRFPRRGKEELYPMKKAVSLLMILALLLGCAACGSPKTGDAQNAAGSGQRTEEAAPSDGPGEKDAALIVNGSVVTPDMAVADVLAILGSEYSYEEAPSCIGDGLDGAYTFENAILYTYKDAQGERMTELSFSGGDVKTAGGIAIGASRDEVVALYGEPTGSFGKSISYELGAAGGQSASLSFLIRDDAVAEISVSSGARS